MRAGPLAVLLSLAALWLPARAAERASEPGPVVSVQAPGAQTAIPSLPASPVLPAGLGSLAGSSLSAQAAALVPLPQSSRAQAGAASPPVASARAAQASASARPSAAAVPSALVPRAPRPEAPGRESEGSVAAGEQLRGFERGAGEIRASLSAAPDAGGAQAGKRLGDRAFDRARGSFGGDAGAPPSRGGGNGDGGGRDGSGGGSGRGDYRAALRRLGASPAAIAALERASGGRSAPLASAAAAVVHERPAQLSGPAALAWIAGALLRGVPDAPRRLALAQAAAEGLRLPSLEAAWAARLDYLAAVLDSGDDAGKLSKLAAEDHFAYLPAALREDVAEAIRFHNRGRVPSGTGAPLAAAPSRGPPSAAALVREGRAKGLITAAQGEAWLSAAYRDPLTGLPNRLYLDDHLPQLVGRKRTLLTFKLDYLKEINDELDHEAGNKLLQAVASVTNGAFGESVEAVRRSPTGFAVFVDGDQSDALVVGEALRAAVSEQLGRLDKVLERPAPELSGTISVGEAAFAQDAAPEPAFADALARSERARTFAKDVGGGDRVAVDDGGPRLAERRTPAEISARLRARPKLAPLAARFDRARRAPLSDLTRQLAGQAVEASRLVEQAPPQLREELFSVLYRDRLSGLRNRRWLFDNLSTLFKRGGMTRYVALDLDHFGAVNEKLGEEKADLVLKELGALLEERASKRGALALHLSGEEFVLLAGDAVDAKTLAEEVRVAVEAELGARVKARFGVVDPATGKPLAVTISLGVARIKPAEGPKPTLTLATAMAEAMLQRAKESGRNQVSSDETDLTPAALLKRLSRVIRVDAAVREIAAKVFGEDQGKAPAHPLDNTFKTRAEVLKLVGFNPASQKGQLLSSPEKAGSYVARVRPPDAEQRVVKIALESTVVNEMAMRGVLESFELFSENLRAPRAVAYRRWPLNPVMVMEDVATADRRRDARHLPPAHRAALAMFALTFGVHDLNPGAFLDVGWKRTVLTDFERARTPTTVPPDNRLGALSESPWISQSHLNALSDFQPAYDRWRATFARPQAQRELAGILRRAGVPEAQIARDLTLFAENLKRLPQVLEKELGFGNRYFLDACLRAGLDERGARALSAVNRAAERSPEGGAMRDVLRLLIADVDGRRVKPFVAEPEELAVLLRRPKAFSPAARELVGRAAESGRVLDFDGKPLAAAAALAAYDALAALLGPG